MAVFRGSVIADLLYMCISASLERLELLSGGAVPIYKLASGECVPSAHSSPLVTAIISIFATLGGVRLLFSFAFTNY